MNEMPNTFDFGASDESLRRSIVDLIGPEDHRNLSDTEVEAMLDAYGALDLSADQIELILRKAEAEIESDSVGSSPDSAPPASVASASVPPIPSNAPANDAVPSSPVLGFLGNFSLPGYSSTLWTLALLVCTLTLLVAFVIAVRGINIHVDGPTASGGSEQAKSQIPLSTSPSSQSNIPSARPVPGFPPGPAARLAAVHCQWVDPKSALGAGASLAAGRKLELASGQAEIVFQCGAKVTLRGPAIFEIESANSSYLTIGRLSARADTPQAHGFTVHSRTASTVDLGTEFSVVASADGHSQIRVVEGAVDVRLASGPQSRRLSAGQSLEVEPGTPSVIARIEPGEGTAAFSFPTIEPPSSRDYADASQAHAHISVLRGKPKCDSGPVELLLDGKGQSRADAPGESFFFEDNTSGLILLDLGRKMPVKKVNTYSWHQHHLNPGDHLRATQKYYLYGSQRAAPPGAGRDLAAAGWTLIAQVDTDEFFGVPRLDARPAQQAVSITAPDGGSIGEYRYLLWDVRPTLWKNENNHSANTFYGEFDVYEDLAP